MGNIAVLWDIENVQISNKDIIIFMNSLNSYCEEIGKRSYSIAVGDWLRFKNPLQPAILSENGFELLLIPQINSEGKKTKDSVDFVLITKATEMIFQYPHIDTYVILTSDIDFRPLVQLLKKHGKTVNIIYNPNKVSEHLLEYADAHKDYRDLIPDETDSYEELFDEDNIMFSKFEAHDLLVEAINQMKQASKVATPGSVKVRMKMINENFSQDDIGVGNWMDFIFEAERLGHIKTQQINNDIILSTQQLSQNDQIFDLLVDEMRELSEENDWILFTTINQILINKGIAIKDYNYSKFKKLAIEAETRGILELKNEDLRWYARLNQA